MKRFALVALALAACGTSRDLPDAGVFDGGTGPRPLGLAQIEEHFPCATITVDFDGNYVCADPTGGFLRVLDVDGLGETSQVQVAPSWSNPRVSAGRGGQAFLAAGEDDGGTAVWALDLGDESVVPSTPISGAPTSFHARRDAPGYVYALPTSTDDGGAGASVVVVGEDGGAERSFTLSEPVWDLASAPSGELFASTSLGDACDAILELGGDAGVSLSGAHVPCELGLSADSRTLWLASTGDDGFGALQVFDGTSLQALRTFALDGLVPAPHSVVFDANGDVAVLGADGGAPVALGRPAWLAQDGGFQSLSVDAGLGPPADAAFDEAGALYLADPLLQTIDVVR